MRALTRLHLPIGGRPAPRSRARGRPGTQGRRRTKRRSIVALIVSLCALLLVGGWLWLRDSSLVAVKRVTITGVAGMDAEQVRSALTAAARGMTTLDVRMGTLRAAVSAYPVVKDLRVSTQLPHGLRIHVIEQVPVASVSIGVRSVPVAADGTLLRDVAAAGSLPTLKLGSVPGGARISEPAVLAELRVLGSAPAALLPRIADVTSGYWHGIVVDLRHGPRVYFGGADRLAAKWQAAVAVLTVRPTTGAAYVDVTDPERAASGAH